MKDIEFHIPGKIMLCGEYAVLRGEACLAAAVDRFVHVSASMTDIPCHPRVTSNLWREPKTLADTDEFLIRAIQQASQERVHTYSEIKVDSNIRKEDGFGNSSALSLAVSALYQDHGVLESAIDLQRSLQGGVGSGYDVAAQWHGGVIRYQNIGGKPQSESITCKSPMGRWLTVLTGGTGAPTTALTTINLEKITEESLWQDLIQNAKGLETVLRLCIEQSFPKYQLNLFDQLNQWHEIFVKLDGYPTELMKAAKNWEGFQTTWHFKTTGAGGEDALLIFGSKFPEDKFVDLGWQKTPITFGVSGLKESLL